MTLRKCDIVHNWLDDNVPDHAHSQSVMTTNIRWLVHLLGLNLNELQKLPKVKCLFKP